MSTKEKAVILYADASRGRYIPAYFAASIDRATVQGIDPSFLGNLADPMNFDYWEDW